ncbi:MAG: hypothetical protein ACKOOC_09810 [Cyanobium sp.]
MSTLPRRPQRLLGFVLAATSWLALSTDDVQAQALPCSFGGNPLNTDCNSGPYDTFFPSATDKQITLYSTSQDGSKGPTTGSGRVGFAEFERPEFPDGVWVTGALFDGNVSAPGTFDYSITITDPDFVFDTVGLAWTGELTASVNKQFFIDATYTTPVPGLPVLTSNYATGGSFLSLPSGFTTLYVRDTYTGGIRGMANGYTQRPVPGPLPLLGAGAAFGFSRRLRRRIKLSQKLG